MRAPRLLLVPAMLVALAGCATTTGASLDDAALISRDARAMPDADASVELRMLDASTALDAASLTAWHPSDVVSSEAWVDVSWVSGHPACGGQVEGARIEETDARVVIDLPRGGSHLAEGGAACGDVGYAGSARIPLREPVGDRELLQHAAPAG